MYVSFVDCFKVREEFMKMVRTKKTETKKKATVAEATKALAAKTEKLVDTVTKKVSADKATTKKDASSYKVSVVLQYAGKDVAYDELVQNAKNKFQYDMGGNVDAIKEISLYVKPEENKVYFVIDGTEGDYDL